MASKAYRFILQAFFVDGSLVPSRPLWLDAAVKHTWKPGDFTAFGIDSFGELCL